jgi:NAD(P)-dependent dehydrogenase (short-subunit alcohol dehydrogenase family)
MANIVITGAGKGLGAALLMAFARESGHKITGFSRNIDSVRQQIDLQEDILSDIHLFSADLVTESPESIVQKITQHLSSVDILINNAGFLVAKPFAETSSDDFDTIFNTNVKSVYFLIQQLLPYFSSGSHIVNIGSMGGLQGSKKFSGISAYSISKGALATLSECLAEELAPQNIRVNCLAMGAVQTEMLAEAFPGFKAPLQASEMAEFIRNFALNAHHYLNGKVIPLSISTP